MSRKDALKAEIKALEDAAAKREGRKYNFGKIYQKL